MRNGLLNPLDLPVTSRAVSPGVWDAWLRLLDVAALQKDLPGGEPSLVDLLQMLEDPAVTEDAFLAELTTRTAWLLADLETLTTALAVPYPAGWRDGTMLRRLVDAFALIGRLGVSGAQADAWATAPIDAAQAEALRLAAKSKHDEERWPAVARALRDPVRDKQRAALVAYLIARDPCPWRWYATSAARCLSRTGSRRGGHGQRLGQRSSWDPSTSRQAEAPSAEWRRSVRSPTPARRTRRAGQSARTHGASARACVPSRQPAGYGTASAVVSVSKSASRPRRAPRRTRLQPPGLPASGAGRTAKGPPPGRSFCSAATSSSRSQVPQDRDSRPAT